MRVITFTLTQGLIISSSSLLSWWNCLGNNLNSQRPLLTKQHILSGLEQSNYSDLEPR